MRAALAALVMLLTAAAAAADDPSEALKQAQPSPQKAPPAAVRNAIIALQQQGAALETLSGYYDARIDELKRLCGDPCKDK